MKYIHDNSKPFYFKGNNVGCLLIHGFTGCPAEMRLLGEYLNQMGYTVKGVQLKGHGTKIEDMESSTWRDWLDSAEEDLNFLLERCNKVFIIGLSMGAIISLVLSSKYEVSGVVSLAAPIKIADKRVYYSPILKYLKKYVPKREKIVPKEIKDYVKGYNKTPVASIPHMLKLVRMAKRSLRKIQIPILIIQSKDDNTVEYKGAEILLKKVKSRYKKLVFLKESGHVITIGVERQKVFKEIGEFINQISQS